MWVHFNSYVQLLTLITELFPNWRYPHKCCLIWKRTIRNENQSPRDLAIEFSPHQHHWCQWWRLHFCNEKYKIKLFVFSKYENSYVLLSRPKPKWKNVDLSKGRSSNSWTVIGRSISCHSELMGKNSKMNLSGSVRK